MKKTLLLGASIIIGFSPLFNSSKQIILKQNHLEQNNGENFTVTCEGNQTRATFFKKLKEIHDDNKEGFFLSDGFFAAEIPITYIGLEKISDLIAQYEKNALDLLANLNKMLEIMLVNWSDQSPQETSNKKLKAIILQKDNIYTLKSQIDLYKKKFPDINAYIHVKNWEYTGILKFDISQWNCYWQI